MYTPSLGRRVVVAGAAAVAVLAIGLDALVYVSMAATLSDNLEDDLDQAVNIVRVEARAVGIERLPDVLADLRVDARVEVEGAGAMASARADGPSRRVRLGDGSVLRVGVSRADADRTLRRLLAFEAIITPLLVLLSVLILRIIAEFALRPLDQIAAAARRTTGGHRGERLEPEPSDTRLGQMAAAYDDMLDALETAVLDAESANAEAGRLLERNRRIIETAHEAFVAADETGTIVDWNSEAERIFGWSSGEAVGRPLAGTVLPVVPEEDDNGLGRFAGTTGRESNGRIVSLTAMGRNGRRFPARMTVWSTAHRGSETVSAFIWDVTDQLRAEEAVGRLAAVVEATDEAMLSATPAGTILTWNPAAERVFGFSADEAVGRHLDLIVPEELRVENEQACDAVRRDAVTRRLETVRRCRNDTLVEVAITMSPIRDASGAVTGLALTARDITEERWIAAQLDTSLRTVEQALAEARASESDTRRFLDDAAHQIRAPLTSIRACAEGLLRTSDADERDELAGAVVREAARAGRLMTSLLRLARLDHGVRLQTAPCDLLSVCEAEAERIRPLVPHLRVEVGEAPGDPLGRPRVDPEAVSEIVANLVDNARRHARTRVEVVVSCETGWAEVEVRDDGPGLPAAAVESAFDRFVSLDGKGGSGLGLPIARQLARAHGGDLVYRDRAFVLLLPVPDEGAPEGPAEAGPSGSRLVP